MPIFLMIRYTPAAAYMLHFHVKTAQMRARYITLHMYYAGPRI